MATRTSGRPFVPPAATNGSRPRSPVNGAGGQGVGSAKRSAPMAIVGVAAVVAGALIALALYTGLDRRQTVLAVGRSVPAGGVVTAGDLYQVKVAPAAGITPVPVSRAGSVVGKTAAVGLVKGTLLAESQLGSPSTLQAGQAVVGLALKPGQAPATLRPGTRVEVIDTVKPTNAGDQPRPVVLTASAVVSAPDGDAPAKPAANGVTLVSLTLPAADAPAVAAAAMDGRVSLVVLPSAP